MSAPRVSGRRPVALIDADPDLEAVVPPEQREQARRDVLARVAHLSPGAWEVTASREPDRHHRGFLVLDGLLTREVEVIGRRCVELVGPGDVVRPWQWDEEGSHVRAEVGWRVLEPTDMGVLDHGLVERMMPFPQLGVELFTRGTRRAHHLAVALAITHHQRVEDRLLLTLWHLAERWGRVSTDGVSVPLPLGHRRLAELVGATRPSVTTALGELARSGAVSRRDDGTWLLHGAPPQELRHHRLAAAELS